MRGIKEGMKALVWILGGFAVLLEAAPPGPQINSGSPAFPFPQNAAYPFGIKPNHKSAAQFENDVRTLYNTWYQNAVTDSGAGGTAPNGVQRLRVFRNTDGNDTVSEGIGYGMLIAAMMADKPLFDGLYMYARQYMPDCAGNYVMNWRISSGGSVTGCNGATDADVDMAHALLIADRQWGSSGVINYRQEFQTMINAIWLNEIGADGRVEPGDSWTGTYFPSYMPPAWFKCWISQTNNGTHDWQKSINWIYQTFYKTLLQNYPLGFKPENTNGSWQPNTNNHGYDASRYGWRIGQDYLWYGDPFTAANEGPYDNLNPMVDNVRACVNSGSFDSCVQEFWDIRNGNHWGAANSLQIGPLVLAAMAEGSDQTFVNAAYDEMISRFAQPFTYFQDTLVMVCAIVATGNFPNIVCGGGSGGGTPTPTPTPSGACAPVDGMEDGNTQNNYGGYWFTFKWSSGSATESGVSGSAQIVDSTQGAAGTSFSAKVTGYNNVNGPTTFTGFALGTELPVGFQDLSFMDTMEFWVKGSKAATLRVNFIHPPIESTNGGNDNQYGFTFAINTTWQQLIIPRIAIACQNWGPGSCPPNGISRDQALSQVRAIHWQTEGAPNPLASGGLTFWIDEVCLRGVNPMPTPTPTNTPTATNTATLANTPTPTLSPTPTSSPTQTPTPTSTNTPDPLATPTNTFTPTPSPTATNTPAATDTPTATSTPAPPFDLIDDMEDNNNQIATVGGRNGFWYTYSDGTTTMSPSEGTTFTMTAPGAGGSGFAACITGTAPSTWGAGMAFNFLEPKGFYDIAATGATGIRFDIRSATPVTVRVKFPDSNTDPDGGVCTTGCFDDWGVDLAVGTSYAPVTVNFSALSQQGWGEAFPAWVASAVSAMQIQVPSGQAFNLCIDNIRFVGALTPTPTATFTQTATPTRTATFTMTPTATFTDTPVPGATNTPTSSFTPTPTWTSSFTFTATFTPTATPTWTMTFTATPTATFTDTPVPGATNTPTFSSTPTPTWTSSFTATPTPTRTATPSPTPTAVVTDTPTPAATASATPTNALVSVPVTTPVPYPNPVSGEEVKVRVFLGKMVTGLRMQLFTTAYRKVLDRDFGAQSAGDTILTLPLRDQQGAVLSNGVYYIVVEAPGGERSVGKLLVVR